MARVGPRPRPPCLTRLGGGVCEVMKYNVLHRKLYQFDVMHSQVPYISAGQQYRAKTADVCERKSRVAVAREMSKNRIQQNCFQFRIDRLYISALKGRAQPVPDSCICMSICKQYGKVETSIHQRRTMLELGPMRYLKSTRVSLRRHSAINPPTLLSPRCHNDYTRSSAECRSIAEWGPNDETRPRLRRYQTAITLRWAGLHLRWSRPWGCSSRPRAVAAQTRALTTRAAEAVPWERVA